MDDFLLRRKFGEHVHILRRKQGLTQAELAEKIDVTDDFISQIERGISAPSFLTLTKLAEVFNIEVYELFLFNE